MKPANSCILTINGGSSSIKLALYQAGEPQQRGLYGKIDRIGLSGTSLTFDDPVKNRHDSRKLAPFDHKSAANFLMDWLEEQKSFEPLQECAMRPLTHLRGFALPRHRNRPKAKRGKRGRHYHSRQPGHRSRHSNGRGSDDCAVRRPHSQNRHDEQRIDS
jgi:hypothetical protein